MRYETRQSNFSRDEIVRQEELGRALKEYQKHVASINAEMKQFLKLDDRKVVKIIKMPKKSKI